MLVNEAVKRTGLTKKTIYYYEEVGLISPSISANGYRNFSELDIMLLEKIALLRRLDMPVLEIKNYLLLQDTNLEHKMLLAYQKTLYEQQDKLTYQLMLCSRLLNQNIDSYLINIGKEQKYTAPKLPFTLGTKDTFGKTFAIYIIWCLFVLLLTNAIMFNVESEQVISANACLTLEIIKHVFRIGLCAWPLFISISEYYKFQQSEIIFPVKELSLIKIIWRFMQGKKNNIVSIKYHEILDAEIRWQRDNVMLKNWTPTQLYLVVHLKNSNQLLINLSNNYNTMDKFLYVLGLFEALNIPVYDPYNIGDILLKNENVQEHLFKIYQNDMKDKGYL